MTRSVAVVLGTVGGLLVLLGGSIKFWLTWLSAPSLSLDGLGLGLLATLLLGLFILFTARPRWWWWPGRRFFNALVLVVLGALAWWVSDGFVLTALGAVLTIVAGLILPI